jgi:internalin A
VIRDWSDKEIRSGKPWKKEIQKALEQAQAAVLLVSPEFIASDFIHENELPPLLAAARDEDLSILWVPISYSSYSETSIGGYRQPVILANP